MSHASHTHDVSHLHARKAHALASFHHRHHAHASRIDFAILVHSLSDFEPFEKIACSLRQRGYTIRLYLEIAPPDLDPEDGVYTLMLPGDCHVSCTVPFAHAHEDNGHGLSEWLDTMEDHPPVIMFSALGLQLGSTLRHLLSSSGHFSDTTLIQIPAKDLVHCDWMSALTLDAWKRTSFSARYALALIQNAL
jgi:hypothetical protein